MSDRKILTPDSPELTQAQQRKIEYLRKQFAPRGDNYEFKQFEITKLDDYKPVFLLLETGLINDEETMASVFARDRYHFYIGVRGGLQSHDGNSFQQDYTRDSDYQSRKTKIAERATESI